MTCQYGGFLAKLASRHSRHLWNICVSGDMEASRLYIRKLTALGSERLPQYTGEHMGFLIFERVLTVTESFVSGYCSQSIFLALTTCFHRKAQTASVMFGPYPLSVDSLCLSSLSLLSEMKYVANCTGELNSES